MGKESPFLKINDHMQNLSTCCLLEVQWPAGNNIFHSCPKYIVGIGVREQERGAANRKANLNVFSFYKFL